MRGDEMTGGEGKMGRGWEKRARRRGGGGERMEGRKTSRNDDERDEEGKAGGGMGKPEIKGRYESNGEGKGRERI